eukprot:1139955-Pelagomonas_calceolata.AAC.6
MPKALPAAAPLAPHMNRATTANTLAQTAQCTYTHIASTHRWCDAHEGSKQGKTLAQPAQLKHT